MRPLQWWTYRKQYFLFNFQWYLKFLCVAHWLQQSSCRSRQLNKFPTNFFTMSQNQQIYSKIWHQKTFSWHKLQRENWSQQIRFIYWQRWVGFSFNLRTKIKFWSQVRSIVLQLSIHNCLCECTSNFGLGKKA